MNAEEHVPKAPSPASLGSGGGVFSLEPAKVEGAAPLTVVISPPARQRLVAATRNSFWTADLLVERLLLDQLHSAYPVVRYRTVEIAPAGTFRAFDRRSHHPSLLFLTSTGRYLISVRPEFPDFQKLSQMYAGRGSAGPEAEASEMCLFKLQTYLEDCSEEAKIIYPEDFFVRQVVERTAMEAEAPADQGGGARIAEPPKIFESS